MTAGFIFKRKLKIAWNVAPVAGFEIPVELQIRDNLTLNAIVLIHPFEAIRQWYAGPPITRRRLSRRRSHHI